MKKFHFIKLNGKRYLGLGFFAEVGPKKAIIIESDKIIDLLADYHREQSIINEIIFLNEDNKLIIDYQGKFIVDSVINIEATIYPLNN